MFIEYQCCVLGTNTNKYKYFKAKHWATLCSKWLFDTIIITCVCHLHYNMLNINSPPSFDQSWHIYKYIFPGYFRGDPSPFCTPYCDQSYLKNSPNLEGHSQISVQPKTSLVQYIQVIFLNLNGSNWNKDYKKQFKSHAMGSFARAPQTIVRKNVQITFPL